MDTQSKHEIIQVERDTVQTEHHNTQSKHDISQSKHNTAESKRNIVQAKPVLKWAGGKTQILDDLLAQAPASDQFNRYIEPFIGGGAMFFAMHARSHIRSGVIADSNPELINLYRCIANNVEEVIEHLRTFRNTENNFYEIRSLQFERLGNEYAAARTIYLNKTCFNGLYRVNRNGQFNTPFGRYRNPTICQPETLHAASLALKDVEILCGDFRGILESSASPGDFVYLDPPYLPVSKNADFKRYTREQFHEQDHRDLAKEVERLRNLGCYVILTNSDHPVVRELYEPYKNMKVISTRRSISSKGKTRRGKDVVITINPCPRFDFRMAPAPVDKGVLAYPPTRYMGSKNRLLPYIRDVASRFDFESALDLFSGSGIVGYLFKRMGKQVYSNDYMVMNAEFSKAMIENNCQTLAREDVGKLFMPNPDASDFVQKTFSGLYFTDAENAVIDLVRSNIYRLPDDFRRSIAMSALIRACIKKRARGIFTYTGLGRYNDGRMDLRMSIEEQFCNAVELINAAVFDNGQQNRAFNEDAMTFHAKADLVYIDPPYYSPFSDNEYVRRYHFVEGLARNWEGVDIQWHTKTRKFRNYSTPFGSRSGTENALNEIFERWNDSILLVSYSSNSLPSREEIISLISRHKRHVETIDIDYRYNFGNQRTGNRNEVQEYLFVGYD